MAHARNDPEGVSGSTAPARGRWRRGGRGLYRVVVGVLGGVVVVVGLVLVPFPGPGWAVVLLGLALLATEFAWAARLQRYVRAKLGGWVAWLADQGWAVRALVGVATVAVLGVAGYAALLWQGLPGWVPPGLTSWVPGL